MSIPFTQYLMPDGRAKDETIDRPAEIEIMAHKIIKAGYRFEIEMLSDFKTISMECIHPKTERVLAGELCHNGPTDGKKCGVPESVDKMVRDAFAQLPS